jgi:hypothetical protein
VTPAIDPSLFHTPAHQLRSLDTFTTTNDKTMGSESMAPPAPLSKRQRRRQGSHPSTTWQQQPRIKSASARAKAYITYAGLSDATNNNKAKKTKAIDPQLDLHSPEVKFGRMLGSTDQRKRHEAVKMLQQYLRARAEGTGISHLDLMKLWKVR